jgi:hypothetical protein
MKKLVTVPEGYDEIVEEFGDCHSADFYKENIVWQRSPIILRLSWDKAVRIGGFLAHRLVGPVIADAITELRDFGEMDYLKENDYDLWGGCFNPRGKRGGGGTSTHSWGIAVDWCPALGPMGGPTRMPQFIVDAFVKRGFVWGGDWEKTDGMHFQAASGW